MYNILMLLKTNGLQYDDRVKKECISLTQLNNNIEIAVLENTNEFNSGQIYNKNVIFKSYKLWMREIVKGNSYLFIKLVEWFVKLIPMIIKKRDIVWVHDPIMFVFIPFFVFMRKIGRVRKVVWDLHELPPDNFLKNSYLRFIFRRTLESVDEIIHANEERGNYLNEYLGVSYKFKVIRNFVSDDFSCQKISPLPNELVEWLDNSQYIFLQSGLYKERCFDTVAESICNNVHIKCVVIGGYNQDYLAALRKKYNNFDDYFYIVGMVEQKQIVDYLVPACLSLILYDSSRKNAELCEPNRLYYSISRKVPVITGSNQTMANIVRSINCGLVLADSGESVEILTETLREFFSGNKSFRFNFDCFWSSQNQVIEAVVK